MSIHDGHRERMRQRIKKNGLASFEPHEVLEVLLYYCIPRGNTNEIAHSLLQHYKTIGGVLQASVKELQTFKGVGENAAFFLSLLNEANRYINLEKASQDSILSDVEAYGRYLKPLFDGVANEAAYMICLDAKCAVINHYKLSEGSAVSTGLPIRKIIDIALTCNAASVILAHNHPGGFAIPSQEDKEATLFLARFLHSIDIVLADHLIFSQGDYVSLLESAKSDSRYAALF